MKIKHYLCILAVGFATLVPRTASAVEPTLDQIGQLATAALNLVSEYNNIVQIYASNPLANETIINAAEDCQDYLNAARAAMDSAKAALKAGTLTLWAAKEYLATISNCARLALEKFLIAKDAMAAISAPAAAAGEVSLVGASGLLTIALETAYLCYVVYDWNTAMQEAQQANIDSINWDNQLTSERTSPSGLVFAAIKTQREVEADASKYNNDLMIAGASGSSCYLTTCWSYYTSWLPSFPTPDSSSSMDDVYSNSGGSYGAAGF